MIDLIDNTLHALFIASFNYCSDEEGRAKHSACDSVNWYVWSGRASTPWIKALAKADPNKLLNRVVQGDQSVDGQIATITIYLKRYCGY